MKLEYSKRPIIFIAVSMIASIIAALTLPPNQVDFTPVPSGHDKIYHAIAFGVLAFPVYFAANKSLIWSIVAVVLYGLAIELIQPYFGRSMEFLDLVADAVGAVIGIGLAALLNLAISHPRRAP